MSKFRFELTSETPCLFHADNVEEGDELKQWRSNPNNASLSVAGDDRSPPWSWMHFLYHHNGHLAVPGDNLMVALRYAGGKIIMKKQTTFKGATQSGLMIEHEYCEFRGPKGQVPMEAIFKLKPLSFAKQKEAVKSLGFDLFVKRAKVGSSKHVRVRARFEEWSITGTILVTEPAITDDVLAKLFEIAGTYAGLLDWRPSSPKSPGPFGKFTTRLRKLD